MFSPFRLLAVLALLLLFMPGCWTGADNEKAFPGNERDNSEIELVISAAVSVRDPVEEIGGMFEEKRESISLEYNFASSGVLQNQVERGAPADVYISAGVHHMEKLEEKHLIFESTRIDLLKNELVLITPLENRTVYGFSDLVKEDVAEIAIGIPDTVPAGAYAQELLNYLEIWEELEHKLVFARSVQQAAAYVQTGNADAGIVFRTDVKADEVDVRASAPPGSHRVPLYQAAVVNNTENKEEAEKFLSFLQGERAGEVFTSYGFEFLP